MRRLLCLPFFIFVLSAVCLSQDQGEPTNAEEAAAQKAKAAAELDAKYQAWVHTLTPAQQAWERVLQSELGGFYLPIHQRQKVAGQSNAWDFVENDPSLPRVLLIGDSVSRAYTQTVRKELAGKANVHRAPANCGPTATGLKKMEVWLGDGKWDIIHFNFGIHDRNTPIADYTDRLEQLVERMRQTGATLIWANTTPLPEVPGQYTAASVIERNAAAAKVMAAQQIAVNDLFEAIIPRLGELQNPNDCHFNGPGNTFLGETVARFIEQHLGRRHDISARSGKSRVVIPDEHHALLMSHCYKHHSNRHDAKERSGQVRLDDLSFDLANNETADRWQKIIGRTPSSPIGRSLRASIFGFVAVQSTAKNTAELSVHFEARGLHVQFSYTSRSLVYLATKHRADNKCRLEPTSPVGEGRFLGTTPSPAA